jgi:hypothetical protein
LNIANNDLGPIGALHLRKLTNLTRLDIAYNKLRLEDVANLATLLNLTSADMENGYAEYEINDIWCS